MACRGFISLVVHHPEVRCGQAVGIHLYVFPGHPCSSSAALTSASPAAIIGWSILYGICDVCGYKKGDGYPTMMVFGIVFASQVGMSLIPFKQAAAHRVQRLRDHVRRGDRLRQVHAHRGNMFLCAVLAPVHRRSAKYVFKPDMKKLNTLDASRAGHRRRAAS